MVSQSFGKGDNASQQVRAQSGHWQEVQRDPFRGYALGAFFTIISSVSLWLGILFVIRRLFA